VDVGRPSLETALDADSKSRCPQGVLAEGSENRVRGGNEEFVARWAVAVER